MCPGSGAQIIFFLKFCFALHYHHLMSDGIAMLDILIMTSYNFKTLESFCCFCFYFACNSNLLTFVGTLQEYNKNFVSSCDKTVGKMYEINKRYVE